MAVPLHPWMLTVLNREQTYNLFCGGGRQSRLPSHIQQVVRSHGRSLDAEAKYFLKLKTAVDPSKIRLHTGAAAGGCHCGSHARHTTASVFITCIVAANITSQSAPESSNEVTTVTRHEVFILDRFICVSNLTIFFSASHLFYLWG